MIVRRMMGMRNMWQTTFLVVVALSARTLPAVEIHSNGQGGGNWNSPTTWHGGKVPQSLDTVVIAMRDTVAYDRVGILTPACAGLFLDPEAILTFKQAEGKTVLAVDGSIESYGVIKIDGTKSRDGSYELRVVSRPGLQNVIRLLQDSALLVYGREGLPENARNVIIHGAVIEGTAGVIPTMISNTTSAMVDVQRATLKNVQFYISSLDNTGAKPNERLNLIHNQFHGQSNLVMVACDTPAVRNNEFRKGLQTGDYYAIHGNGNKLADISANSFIGSFTHGVYLTNDTDSPIINNRFEGCKLGIYWHGANGIIKKNRLERCHVGVYLDVGTAVLEDISIEQPMFGVQVANSVTHQLTSCRIEKVQKGGSALHLISGAATAVNCNISPDQIKLEGTPAGGVPFLQTMDYVIVKVTGNIPTGSTVQVQTAAASGGVPAGKADLNVSNSPNRLNANHETMWPVSTRCLTVKSWIIAANKQRINAPFYDVSVVAPPVGDKPGQPPRVLAKQMVEPALTWFQINPAAPQPTFEVKLP